VQLKQIPQAAWVMQVLQHFFIIFEILVFDLKWPLSFSAKFLQLLPNTWPLDFFTNLGPGLQGCTHTLKRLDLTIGAEHADFEDDRLFWHGDAGQVGKS
jgi:hypothetical protein